MGFLNVLPEKSPNAKAGRGELFMEGATLFALFLSPIVYLSVRHGIHICLFFVTFLALADIARNPDKYLPAFSDPWVIPILISLGSIFVATGISQAFRHNMYWPSFDGPARILLACLVFLFLRSRAISFAKVLEMSVPVGLIVLFMALQVYPDTSAFWDGRFATRFVDPNTLGSQSLILSLLCLFSIGLFGKENGWLLSLKIIGAGMGLYITIHAQSRGGWLAIPALLLLWLILHFSGAKHQRAKQYLLPFVLACGVIAALMLAYDFSAVIANRLNSGYLEISDWLSGRNIETAAGIRLTMWKISFLMAQDSPWVGFGENGFDLLFAHHPLNIPVYRSAIDTLIFAGPHSDILAKLLSLGMVGLLAYFFTLLIPAIAFWAMRNSPLANVRAASHFGLYFIAGVFVCGLANEMLSLKYLCSFYGLMIAGLSADIAKPGK